jgi:competence ComEA-like helix-hairpin-helix protein
MDIETDGSVAVVKITDQDCCAYFDCHLAGCPSCDEPNCVVLATVENYHLDDRLEDVNIDNRKGRKLLPSTQKLADILECICESGLGGQGVPGSQGPPGPPGPPGPEGQQGSPGQDGTNGRDGIDGTDGKDGEGLEPDLTHIKALSWIHRKEIGFDSLENFILDIKRINQEEPVTPGIVIGFDNNVHVADGKSPIDSRHIFQVSFPVRLTSGFNEELYLHKQFNEIFNCSCPIFGKVIPVDFEPDDAEKIEAAWEVEQSIARGVAFVFEQRFFQEYKYENFWDFLKEYASQFDENDKLDIWVRLRGEFVIDEKDRAIDAEFARGELLTGDRPSGSKFGVQGGLFESWFTISLKNGKKKINLNTASVREIADGLPRIGDILANRIVRMRAQMPFKRIEDLLKVNGITENILDEIRDLISFK